MPRACTWTLAGAQTATPHPIDKTSRNCGLLTPALALATEHGIPRQRAPRPRLGTWGLAMRLRIGAEDAGLLGPRGPHPLPRPAPPLAAPETASFQPSGFVSSPSEPGTCPSSSCTALPSLSGSLTPAEPAHLASHKPCRSCLSGTPHLNRCLR